MEMEVTAALLKAQLQAQLVLERLGAGGFQAHHRDQRREAVQELVEPSPGSNVEFSGPARWSAYMELHGRLVLPARGI